jgi:hypothetical protein
MTKKSKITLGLKILKQAIDLHEEHLYSPHPITDESQEELMYLLIESFNIFKDL